MMNSMQKYANLKRERDELEAKVDRIKAIALREKELAIEYMSTGAEIGFEMIIKECDQDA